MPLLTPRTVSLVIESASNASPVDSKALEDARSIISSFTSPNPTSTMFSRLLSISTKFNDLPPTATSPLIPPSALEEAYNSLTPEVRQSLNNLHSRITAFATMQRSSISDTSIAIPGGFAGQSVSPCSTAGCYAPGGRYPLPSSVLMTCITAKVAGCGTVIVCSPNPQPITLAAGHVCGVTSFFSIGGAQAIGAMAHGISDAPTPAENIPPCDVIVGPGNKWVTAAKSLVAGHKCGIDMLAGPSEVLVVADESADCEVVAADLIAQAEHDVVARPILVAFGPTGEGIIKSVNDACERQLEAMPEPNKSTARAAFENNGFSVLCKDLDEAVKVSDSIAPEHLEVFTKQSTADSEKFNNYGGLFVGQKAAEVLGDYGAGPNHTLPTGGAGKYTGGLSVFNFLRIRTWMRCDEAAAGGSESYGELVEDCIRMAREEGLEGHARAAELRR